MQRDSRAVQRCDRHGLNYDAALTAGCVLCRRNAQPTQSTTDAPGPRRWPLMLGLIASVCALGFTVRYYVARPDAPAPAASNQRVAPRGATTPAGESAAAAGQTPAPATAAPADLHPLDPQLWTEVATPFEPHDALDPAAQELRDRYGIQIYVPRTPQLDVERGKLTGSRPTPAQISEAALALRKELARYPSEFIGAIGFQRVVLIEGVKQRGVPASAFAIAPAAALVATPAMFSNPYGLHHELFHFADYRLLGRPPDDSAWIALNAPGTRYGSGGRRMVASVTGSYSRLTEPRRDLPGFVNEYASSAPEEDRAEVFAMLVAKRALSAELAANDPVIAAKMRYVTDAIERLCPRPCALIEQPQAATTVEEQPAAPQSGPQTITVSLTSRAPLSSLAEIQRRVGWSNADLSAPDEDYEVGSESFDLFIPASYRAEAPHGLLVWISASPTGLPPPAYADVLARHRLLWAAARNSGNQRKAPVRVNLSLDVAAAVKTAYNVDPERVWVGGFSGGGRSASKAALLYPEVFAGGLFVVGAEYSRDVGPNADGKRWKSNMPQPDRGQLLRARPHHFVLLTGNADPNREELQQIHREYVADGYQHAQILVAPNMGHQMPSAEILERAFELLEGRQ